VHAEGPHEGPVGIPAPLPIVYSLETLLISLHSLSDIVYVDKWITTQHTIGIQGGMSNHEVHRLPGIRDDAVSLFLDRHGGRPWPR